MIQLLDLTEAEGIKKRWQEYIEELYNKDLNDMDKRDSMKSSGPLEASLQTKLVDVMEFQLSYFKS